MPEHQGIAQHWKKGLVVGIIGFWIWLKSEWLLVAIWLAIFMASLFTGADILHLWIILILGVCLMVSEMLNTAIEKLCNIVEPNYNSEIKVIKDICTGAVLVSGIALMVVGVWTIFDLGEML